jgi:DNA repair photolyase
MEVKEIKCVSILNPSKIPGVDYCINPYTGCSHACSYCYADFMAKYAYRRTEDWGRFVHVKVNAVKALEKQIGSMKKGIVFMSSVTDPYQPLEKEYKLTREIIRVLLRYGFPVSIQTKSSLVLRDMDLLKKFKDLSVGFTIAGDDSLARFEPGASKISERISALEELHNNGIRTYVFIGPVLPFVTRPLEIIKTTQKFTDYYLVDRLNLKGNTWIKMQKFLLEYDRELIPRWHRALRRGSDYYKKVKQEVLEYCEKESIECRFCY